MLILIFLVSLTVSLATGSTGYQSWYHQNFRIYVPSKIDQSKTYELIIFFTGFQSVQPTKSYNEILAGWATEGNQAVILAWNGLGISNVENPYNTSTKFINDHFGFVKDGLDDFLESKTGVKPRWSVDNVYLAGHSAGNRLVALLSTKIPTKGLIMLDPVDQDPLGLTPSILTSPYPYNSSMFIMTTRFGSQKGNSIVPPCVTPGAGLQYFNFFPNASRYMVEALDYGHADLLSPDRLAWTVGKSGFCKSVQNPTENTYQAFKEFIVSTVKSFVDVGRVDETQFKINALVYRSNETQSGSFSSLE